MSPILCSNRVPSNRRREGDSRAMDGGRESAVRFNRKSRAIFADSAMLGPGYHVELATDSGARARGH